MENQKFVNLVNGLPEKLSPQELMEFEAYCAGLSLPLEKIIQIGATLYKVDQNSCFDFLSFIQKHELSRNTYKDFTHQRWKIQIYNTLVALTLAKALRQSDKENMDRLVNESKKYLNSSINVKMSTQKSIVLLRGFLTYYNGDFSNAINIFNKSDEEIGSKAGEDSIATISLLGLAQIYFVKKNYAKALENYKKALVSNRHLPVKARLGMAYCFYELQKYQLAEMCFRRILKLDENCAEAYMGLAVIRYKDEDYPEYFYNLKIAHKLEPNNVLVLLHLAEHFFYAGDFQKVLKLCEKGLKEAQKMPKFLKPIGELRNDYETYKARFNNLIGQVYHIKNDYETCIKYYLEAKDKNLNHNEIGLAQAYIHSNLLKDALEILQAIFAKNTNKKLKLVGDICRTVAYLQVKLQVNPKTDRGPDYYYKQALKYSKNDFETLIDYSVYMCEINKEKTLKILLNAKQVIAKTNNRSKTQLYNNIGTSYIETNQIAEAIASFKLSLQELQNEKRCEESERKEREKNVDKEMRFHALHLTVNFNLSIAYEKMSYLSQAIQIHEKLIEYNKYYVDSYVRLAEVEHKLNNKKKAYEILERAMEECGQLKLNSIRLDKIITMKGHLLHLDGNNAEAKETFKKLGKMKYVYGHFYEICLGYEISIQRQLDFQNLKNFLRPNREYCIGICHSDHYNFQGYLLLTVLLTVDRKITKEQGISYFNQLKVAELEFPEVLFNYGMFLLLNEDYESALFSFNRYRQKTRNHKADEYIALAFFLANNFDECIRRLKKNIMEKPWNLRYRYQFAFAYEKKVQQLYDEEKNFQALRLSNYHLRMSRQIYSSLNRLNTVEYLKTVDTPESKDKLRTQIMKLRSICEDRKRFVSSQMQYYARKESALVEKERKIKQEQKRLLDDLEAAKRKKKLMEQLYNDSDEEDEERQQVRKRKQHLANLSRIQEQKARQIWNKIEEEAQAEKEEKKNRKLGGGKKSKKERNREKLQQKQEEENDQSEESFKEEEQKSEEIVIEQKRKKPKKRDRDHHEDNDDERKKNKRLKKQKQKQKEKIEASNDDLSNPPSSEREENDNQSENAYEKPQKKKKREEDEDEDIDYNKFLL